MPALGSAVQAARCNRAHGPQPTGLQHGSNWRPLGGGGRHASGQQLWGSVAMMASPRGTRSAHTARARTAGQRGSHVHAPPSANTTIIVLSSTYPAGTRAGQRCGTAPAPTGLLPAPPRPACRVAERQSRQPLLMGRPSARIQRRVPMTAARRPARATKGSGSRAAVRGRGSRVGTSKLPTKIPTGDGREQPASSAPLKQEEPSTQPCRHRAATA